MINNEFVMNSGVASEYERGVLSIIVPVYNTAAFLPRCLESLIGQTYRDLEIICVNDGSADGSAAILDKFAAKDARIKVIHQENSGVSAARNTGLDTATGEYVTFVDADDWVELDAYEKIVTRLERGADVVWFGTAVEGAEQECYRQVLELHLRVRKAGWFDVTASEIREPGGEIWNKVFRRDLIEKHGLRFPCGLSYGEDKAFTYSFLVVSQCLLLLRDKLYHYRVHEGSAMSRYESRPDKEIMARRVFDHVSRVSSRYGGKQSVSRAVLSLLYDEYLECALSGVSVNRRQSLYMEGKTMKLLSLCHSHQALVLRQEFMPVWERFFHGFIQNREYYGIGKLRIFSITYEFERRVYRFLGRRLFSVCKK